MKTCSGNGDCRTDEDYACVNAEEVEGWSATVVERGKASKKVCAPVYTGVAIPSERPTDVCRADGEASFPDALAPPSSEAGPPPHDGGHDAPADAPDAVGTEAGPGASVDGAADASVDAPADAPAVVAAGVDGPSNDAGRDADAD
jgi:hypothetical protein